MASIALGAIGIGLNLFGLGRSNSAAKAAAAGNKVRAKATQLRNFRERRQLVREAYIKRAQVLAGASATDGELGATSTPVLNSLYSILGRQQQELDFLARVSELDVKAAKLGAASDIAQGQAGLFTGLGNLALQTNQVFPNLFGGETNG